MLKEWSKFKGWVVLAYFLQKPTKEIHVKELARQLGLGPATANNYLRSYAAEGLLRMKKSANVKLYSLINDNPSVNRLKQFHTLAWLAEIGFVKSILDENKAVTGIVLYGTHASGQYDERSDVDVVVFSTDETFPKKAVDRLGKEATLSIYSIAKWRRVSKEFKAAVSKNHVVLYGAGLPE